MTIAVDFDGCLCANKWPEIGEPNEVVISQLLVCQANGDKIILWTCRQGDKLSEAVRWCAEHGLSFDAVNANLPEHIERYGNDSRKVFADEYWDDKAVYAGENYVFRGAWPEIDVNVPDPIMFAKRFKKWLFDTGVAR